MSLSEAVRLLRLYQTVLQMASDRRYDISEMEDYLNLDPNNPDDVEQFIQVFADRKIDRQMMTRYFLNADEEVLAVYFVVADHPTSVGVGPINVIINNLTRYPQQEKIRSLILVSEFDLTSDARKLLAGIKTAKTTKPGTGTIAKTYAVQFILDSQWTYNPTRHALVPRHVALTQSEQEDFFRRTHLYPNQLPILRYADIASRVQELDVRHKTSDPIVAYYGWLPGQVIKVEREDVDTSILNQSSICYRVVSR